jgi:hypothetical protein
MCANSSFVFSLKLQCFKITKSPLSTRLFGLYISNQPPFGGLNYAALRFNVVFSLTLHQVVVDYDYFHVLYTSVVRFLNFIDSQLVNSTRLYYLKE